MEAGKLTNKPGMLLKNRAIEQAVGSITHRRAEHAAGALVQSRDRGSKKRSKTPERSQYAKWNQQLNSENEPKRSQ